MYVQLLGDPEIVPTPNSYSLRICSKSSTFVLQSNEFLRSGCRPNQEYSFVSGVGQIKLPNWANSEYRNHADEPRLFDDGQAQEGP
jgi:hypothetical protein